MNENQDTLNETNPNKANQKRTLRILFLIVLLGFPLIYLYYKTAGKPPVVDTVQTNNVQQQATDITSLENKVKTQPTFDNLVNLSMGYINNKMPGKSIDYLKKAIELNPKSAIAYNNIGVAYIMLQQYQNGIDACTKALSIDNTFQLAKNNLKWGMDERSKTLSLIQTQEQTPQNKRDIPFYIDNGLNYLRIGNYDKAIDVWSKIADIDKKNTAALNNIGTAFMMKNQYDDAISMFKRAIEFEPNNQLAKNNLAWAMDEKGKAEVSIKK